MLASIQATGEPLLSTDSPHACTINSPHDLSAFPPSLKGSKILLCTESFGPVNGVSRTTLMILDHLRAHGAHVAVVAPLNHTEEDEFVSTKGNYSFQNWDEETGPQVRIRGYPLPFNPELSVVYPVRLSALYKDTFGGPPDIIYLASPASLGFQVLLQLRQQRKENQVPVIANFQTDLAGYCQVLFPQPFGRLASHTFGAVEGYLFRHPSVKAVLYPSRFVSRYLLKHGVPEEKMHLLRRGVDTAMFAPSKRSDSLRRNILNTAPDPGSHVAPAPPADLVLIAVSRLAGEKGFNFLAGVTKRLADAGLPFKLYVVGGNKSRDVEKEVRGMFDPSLVAKKQVIFAGLRTGEALAAAYASADVFLHCSVTETFGLVVLESMASGVPVVARDRGGPSDIVANGSSGFLVDPDDMEAFAQKVLLLARDKRLRASMSNESRRLACDATWEKIGNTVAWRMSDCIEEREDKAHDEAMKTRRAGKRDLATAINSPLDRILRSDLLVDARLAGGFGVIIWFWGAVGVYLVFSRFAIWLRARGPLSGIAGGA